MMETKLKVRIRQMDLVWNHLVSNQVTAGGLSVKSARPHKMARNFM